MGLGRVCRYGRVAVMGCHVIAYDRGESWEYSNLSDCASDYGFTDRYALVRAINENGVAPSDGYTTFDWTCDTPDRLIRSMTVTAYRKVGRSVPIRRL